MEILDYAAVLCRMICAQWQYKTKVWHILHDPSFEGWWYAIRWRTMFNHKWVNGRSIVTQGKDGNLIFQCTSLWHWRFIYLHFLCTCHTIFWIMLCLSLALPWCNECMVCLDGMQRISLYLGTHFLIINQFQFSVWMFRSYFNKQYAKWTSSTVIL